MNSATAGSVPVHELIADSRIADFLLSGEVYSAEMSCVARLRASVLNGEAQGCEAVAVRAMRNFF